MTDKYTPEWSVFEHEDGESLSLGFDDDDHVAEFFHDFGHLAPVVVAKLNAFPIMLAALEGVEERITRLIQSGDTDRALGARAIARAAIALARSKP